MDNVVQVKIMENIIRQNSSDTNREQDMINAMISKYNIDKSHIIDISINSFMLTNSDVLDRIVITYAAESEE